MNQKPQISPLAPKSYPNIPPLQGVRFATASAGIKYAGRQDVMLAVFDEGTQVAGVFTRSLCASAPVDWCRKALPGGSAQALIVNSGNANAFTGMNGQEQVEKTANIVSDATGIPADKIFLASTGVIGEPIDASKFSSVIGTLKGSLSGDGLPPAAKAIMTTDTYPKMATASARIDGHVVTINGMAKGAGMIAPDMATMLSFIFTDAAISSTVLQDLLTRGVDGSFNAITVDSDTSTSDTLMLFATGASQKKGAPLIVSPRDPRLKGFRKALNSVLLDLAHQVVRDGEGCRKFVEINVQGAASKKAAKKIAMSIANSPLVKTAIAGEDANWGRVVMAVGKAGEKANRDKLAIWFGDIQVAKNGLRNETYNENEASAYMKHDAIKISVDVGVGKSASCVWTCDLTKEYIAINGDYRS